MTSPDRMVAEEEVMPEEMEEEEEVLKEEVVSTTTTAMEHRGSKANTAQHASNIMQAHVIRMNPTARNICAMSCWQMDLFAGGNIQPQITIEPALLSYLL